jgi:hypothetical protein
LPTFFHGNAGSGIGKGFDQVLNEILPNPFFRSEYNPFLSDRIKEPVFVFLPAHPEVRCWECNLDHDLATRLFFCIFEDYFLKGRDSEYCQFPQISPLPVNILAYENERRYRQ